MKSIDFITVLTSDGEYHHGVVVDWMEEKVENEANLVLQVKFNRFICIEKRLICNIRRYKI